MKKLFALILTVAMLFSLSVTAFAEEPDGNLSITRDGVTTYYEYIVEAFENAVDGDVIKVEQDYIEEYCNVAYWEEDTLKTVTFDLNGKEIHFPEYYDYAEDNGELYIDSANVTFIDTVGGGIIHALVEVCENAIVQGGTYRGFWAL